MERLRKYIRFLVQEKMAVANVGGYVKEVADAYTNAPSFEPEAVPHWNALISQIENVLYPKINSQLKRIYKTTPEFAANPGGGGIVVVNYHPYQTEAEMTKKVMETGVFLVSSADSKHPVWSVEQNIKFRAVHDWYTHIINHAPFSARGELRAYNATVKLLPKEAVPAAFTEIVGQACYSITNHEFGEQKICILHGFDYYNVGKRTSGEGR